MKKSPAGVVKKMVSSLNKHEAPESQRKESKEEAAVQALARLKKSSYSARMNSMK